MNKNSLFFTITLFFIVLIITAHLIVYVGYNITKQQQIDLLVTKYMKTLHRVEKEIFKDIRPPLLNPLTKKDKREYIPPPPPFIFHNKIDYKKFNEELNKYDMSIALLDLEKLESNSVVLAKEADWTVFEYQGYNYFLKRTPFKNLLIKDNIKINKKTQYIILLTILFNIVFISFYIFIIKKLKPLKALKDNIKEFSKGNLNIDTSSSGRDEISDVSNEFNNAIIQIKELTQSRNLFLRNIMHELKTPITKGLLISNMIEDNNYKKSLDKLFFRLEYLINEFAKIEKLTSKNTSLNIKEYRLIDIVDESLDLLFLNISSIELKVNNSAKLKVDFELFSLVIKNLIDNALKYGNKKPIIEIYQNHMTISNYSEKLKKPFTEYTKPFNREYEGSQKGLGLGLYIVSNIINLHGFNLKYKYEENKNIFIINY
ncbi:ArsS family sensor histidine kinase [Malaciobacter canalis]|nr:ArsS family sensor histidine kinase [Malaciobacter canalis]QEE32029.1 two-component system sensor histidine kinase [Malaciobacter canalis]